MIQLRGRTALVTGGAKRIGEAICLALAREGVNIAVHYPSQPDEANELMDKLAEFKIKYWTIKADFSKLEEYQNLIKRTLELTGSLDILINNASIFIPDTMEDAGFNNLMRHIQINAWAPFVLTREFALLTRGSVINILDSKISRYDWGHISYILSKLMLRELSRMTALKYAPGVSVNAIAPDLILPPEGKDEEYLDVLAAKVPLKRHGKPRDVTEAVAYLLKNEFITGQILYVDGGRNIQGI